MPRPLAILPLPDIEGLPPYLRRMAEHVMYRSPSPDYLLQFADALIEAADHPLVAETLVIASRELADELRRRAPDYR